MIISGHFFLDIGIPPLLMNEHSFIFNIVTGRSVINSKGKSGDKYKRILDAAIKVFAKQGFFQSTISQIAREAGVADGTIYLYFKNKDDILVQFFNYKAKQVFDLFREDVELADNAVDKLKNLVRRHLAEFQRDRNMARVFQSMAHQNDPMVQEKIREIRKMYLEIVAEIMEKGQEEGSLRRDLYLSLVKRYILGAVETIINSWLYSGGKYDLTTMAEPLVDLMIAGIGNMDGVAEPLNDESANMKKT